jgi:hypothetical protein
LIDMPPLLHLGQEGGLYPGASNIRPASHERDADRAARLALLDASGNPDAVGGRIVLLSIGMSNTTQEYQRFMQIAGPDPQRNQAVVLVDGAQGGWSADRLADPSQNPAFWSTVQSRLTAAGATATQVQAVWLKEADRQPTLSFPDDALKLQGEIGTIIRDVRTRFPNTRQLYLSSRTYGGYASTNLNPEPFAYQSGFAVKWLVQSQIQGGPALNFDPVRGPVNAPWLSWGPYLWGDGLVPRSDGLTWECSDFVESDGTHPSASGRQKVAEALHAFFKSDVVASRWFLDCAPGDPAVFAAPPEVLDVRVERPTGGDLISWEDVQAVAGSGTVYDLLAGSLDALRAAGDFSGATCAGAGLSGASIASPVSDPPPGEGVYYLVRARNVCGAGTYGDSGLTPDPRDALDVASPCP